MKFQSYITIILLVTVVVLVLLLQRSCKRIETGDNFQNMYNASQDSLIKTVNALGQEKTTTTLMYGEVNNLLKLNSQKDSSIAKLQKLVGKNTISATLFGTSTSGSVTIATTSVKPNDTVIVVKDSIVYLTIYPEYNLKFSNRWEDFNITARKDTFLLNYKIFNEFSFTQEWQKQGKGIKSLFAEKIPVVTVTNLNPKTETIELKSFAVKPKKYSRIKNILMGAAAGSAATLILLNTKK